MKRVVAVMVLLCAMLALPARAQTRAWLERTEIHEGEVVAFTIETDQALQQVDVAPLRSGISM